MIECRSRPWCLRALHTLSLLLSSHVTRAQTQTQEGALTTSTTTLLTRTVTVASFDSKPTLVAKHEGYSLEGCYTWSGSEKSLDRDFTMPLNATRSNDLTPEMCLEACLGAKSTDGKPYEFVVLSSGRDCFCGSSVSSAVVSVEASNCSTPCAGKADVACGGNKHIVLYALSDKAKDFLKGGGDPGEIQDLPEPPQPAPAAAVTLGSLAGLAALSALVIFGWWYYVRRYRPSAKSATGKKGAAVGASSARQQYRGKPDVIFGHGVTPAMAAAAMAEGSEPSSPCTLVTIHTTDTSDGLSINSGGTAAATEAELLRAGAAHAFEVHAPPVLAVPVQTPTTLTTASRRRPPGSGTGPITETTMLRHRRTSSTKPADWAKFDTIIADGRFSPLNTPTRERFFSDQSRRASLVVSPLTPGPWGSSPATHNNAIGGTTTAAGITMAATSSIQHPALSSRQPQTQTQTKQQQQYQLYCAGSIAVLHHNAWSSSPSLSSPPTAATTVGTSIFFPDGDGAAEEDDSPTIPAHLLMMPSAPAPTASASASAGSGLSDRAWHSRRLNTPFPPAGSGGVSAGTGMADGKSKRRSSIAGGYGGVRIGKVDEAEVDEDLVPEPLKVVKAAGGGGSKPSTGGGRGATTAMPVSAVDHEPSVLPIWDKYHTRGGML